MSDTLDIVNVLAFLKSMPKDLGGGKRILSVGSTQTRGQHAVILDVQKAPGYTITSRFVFLVDAQDILRITHLVRLPVSIFRLFKIKKITRRQNKKKPSLGFVDAYPDDAGICLASDYGLRLTNDWFAGDFRDACTNLLANTLENLFWDVANVVGALEQ